MKVFPQLALVFLTSSLFLQDATSATTPRLLPFTADIIAEGEFRAVGIQAPVNAPNTAAGIVGEHLGLELVKSTRRLRAVQGVTFGFQYRIHGVANANNPGFEMRAIHPPMKSHGGGIETVSTAETYVYGTGGIAINDIVYTLSESSEVLPGKWTLQLLYRGQVVVSREFDLEE